MGQKHVTALKLMGKPRTPGEMRRVRSLLRLARTEFGPLPKAERVVVAAASLGEIADFAGDTPDYWKNWKRAIEAEKKAAKLNDGRDRDAWPDPICEPAWERPVPKVEVRPEVVRWLLINRAALRSVHAAGVQIQAAHVPGLLDLREAIAGRPLWCYACVLGGVLLRDARCRTIGLPGCLLTGSPMPGSPDVPALNADRAEIGGAFFLNGGFRVEGEVRLSGARIAGDLVCIDGSFVNPGNNALSANRAEIEGGVFLNEGFRAEGEVWLIGARIAGGLECDDGSFVNPGKTTLNADGAEVGGDVFLRGGFRAKGQVRLLGARIAGGLECTDGSFVNPGKTTLNADGARVTGSLFLKGLREAQGAIDLTRCRVGYLNDRPSATRPDGRPAWPERILLADFHYDGIAPIAPLGAEDRLAWLANHDTTYREYAPDDPPDPQPYRQLAGVLKEMGRETDARAILYGYERRRAEFLFKQGRHRGSDWGRLLRRLSMLDQNHKSRSESEERAASPWRSRVSRWANLARKDTAGVMYRARPGHRHSPLGRSVFRFVIGYRRHTTRARCGAAWACVCDQTVGFGLKRFRVLKSLGVMLLLGMLVFGWHDGSAIKPSQMLALRDFSSVGEQREVINGNRLGSELTARYPKFNPLIYSADSLIPLVNFHQEEFWTPVSGWRKWYLAIHITAGWIIATLFAASFTRLMRHD